MSFNEKRNIAKTENVHFLKIYMWLKTGLHSALAKNQSFWLVKTETCHIKQHLFCCNFFMKNAEPGKKLCNLNFQNNTQRVHLLQARACG